jgi:hypothetical protein
LLHVTQPGRFAIVAHSANGTALDVVDMITGPTERAGEPGATDGRLDLLLDTGTYKLRTYAAAGARGEVALQLSPFQVIGEAPALPANGEVDGDLSDLQQRSYWLTLPWDQTVRLEAAGRALADMRLWRDGRQLVANVPDVSTIEPERSHTLRDLLITGNLPAGRYLVTVYGGPALPWADGKSGSPLHLRTGVSQALRPGWVGGQIGPFGSEIFAATGSDNLFTLETPGPATLTVDGDETEIASNARAPRAELQTGSQASDHMVDVRAAAGTAYQVRSTMVGFETEMTMPGDYWVTANTHGLGGDDVPATLVLAAKARSGFSVLGSNAPEVAAGAAWRHRFNLAGPVSVLFHATEGGPIAASETGVSMVAPRLAALDGQGVVAPQASGLWDVPAGWYALTLAPEPGRAGVADVTIGSPGAHPALAAAGPISPSVTFGREHIDPHYEGTGNLVLFGNVAPGARIGLDARPLPIDLNQRPVRLSQAAGETLELPVTAGYGALAAVEFGRGDVPVEDLRDAGIARLAAPDHARVVAIYRQTVPMPPKLITMAPPAAPVGMSGQPLPSPLHIEAGAPGFFDLAQDRPQSVELNVRQGGLYRVETLGRLHTRGAIGTDFVPELETGDGNGIGQNMLLQGWLRAGRYHVDVTATDSAGHAGLQAEPAPLRTAASLIPGGSVRAGLPAGTGLLVPITISTGGSYKLDLIGLSHQFTARLEDSEGWPLTASSQFSTITQDLAPGRYRLLVSPEAVDTQLVSRLAALPKPVALSGHGPFPLPFGTVAYTWREPPGRNDSRTPDSWSFSLAGPSDISVTLTDGMEAALRSATGAELAHIVGLIPYTGHLAPGAYRIEARSQGRNDRLDYQLGLSATQLQPGTPRDVVLPSQQHFALGRAQVVNLTSFGDVPVRAILRDGAGRVLGRYGAREDEWNIAVSRLLTAGSYTLDLASAAAPAQTHTHRNVNDTASAQDNDASTNDEAESEPAQTTDEAPAQDQNDTQEPFPARQDTQEADSQKPAGHTELTLMLPPESPPVDLTSPTTTLTGGGVHYLLLPSAKPDTLLLAGAASSATLQVSLDRQDQSGWHSIATAQGLAPIVAVPIAEDAGAWRLAVWAVDPGAPEIHVAAQAVSLPSQAPAHALRLTAMPLPGVRPDLAIARIQTPNRAMLGLAGPAEGVLTASWPGHAMSAPNGGLVVPQAGSVWVVARAGATIGLDPLPAGRPVALTLPAGARAALPRQPAQFCAWVAEAAGQPGLAGGHGMGVAAGSAMALITPGGAPPAITLRSAGGEDDLRVTASPVALRETCPAAPGGLQSLAPASLIRIPLPDRGLHRLRLDLPPGTAAVADGGAGDAVTVWAGHQAVSRTLEGAWREVWLVNTNADTAPVSLAADDVASAEAITPNHAMKRFFGAGGSADVAVTARAGQTLIVAGANRVIFAGDDGSVRRGPRLALGGPGRVILEHSAGLVAAWLEGGEAAPWPVPDAVPVALPATLKMTGAAMRLDLAPAAPVVLRIRGSAPAILALNDQPPSLFPAGAADSAYLAAGSAHLRIISPQDGPLSGTIELTATPVYPATEGLGPAVAVAPGDAVAFSFTLRQASRIGIGVRAEPDRAMLYLLDAEGHALAAGAALLRDLPAGDFVLLARVPTDAPTTTLQPALIGLRPHANGPPPDTVEYYRKLAGLTRKDAVP